VPVLDHGGLSLKSVPERDAAKGIDCAVICTNHAVFNYADMPKRFPLVVDTRNALKGVDDENIFRL
jgi:UDP-N-acetyl-D-mannosaminuronate dehydrogenase